MKNSFLKIMLASAEAFFFLQPHICYLKLVATYVSSASKKQLLVCLIPLFFISKHWHFHFNYKLKILFGTKLQIDIKIDKMSQMISTIGLKSLCWAENVFAKSNLIIFKLETLCSRMLNAFEKKNN